MDDAAAFRRSTRRLAALGQPERLHRNALVQRSATDRFISATDPSGTATTYIIPSSTSISLTKCQASMWLIEVTPGIPRAALVAGLSEAAERPDSAVRQRQHSARHRRKHRMGHTHRVPEWSIDRRAVAAIRRDQFELVRVQRLVRKHYAHGDRLLTEQRFDATRGGRRRELRCNRILKDRTWRTSSAQIPSLSTQRSTPTSPTMP
ncbi:hypothetical protein P4123_28165 [Pseudomonas aeruginosa]|nr:hypothetical protein [Pseudomonas aeruginosa]